MATISLKLLVDTEQNRVLFAEAGKDFVDFLFTLLSFPAGTIIRLLSKDTMVGSLGKLYESIENFSDTYIQPNLNKDILLKPKEPGSVPNNLGLLTNVETTERKVIYTCSNSYSRYYDYSYHTHSDTHPYFSEDPKAQCPECGESLSCKMSYVPPPSSSGSAESSAGKGVGFVKPVVTYMIMDDLEVKPMSTISTIALLNQFNVRDFGALEQKVVDLGMDEVSIFIFILIELIVVFFN